MAATTAAPNIVLILADDMGFSDIGCFGSEIRTPNLDALAADGVRFTQMYNCARCCPSRASLLTGLYPHQAGVGFMVSDLGHPSYQGYINSSSKTVAEVLRAAGYQTAMSGKWHVGGRFTTTEPAVTAAGGPGYPRPIDRGFDSFYGVMAGAVSYYNPHSLMENDQFVSIEDPDYYFTDAIADHAASTIRSMATKDRPYFSYVAFTAPHWPLHAPEEEIERYRAVYRHGWDVTRTSRHESLRGAGLVSDKWAISKRDDHAPPWSDIHNQEWWALRMAVYAAQIDRMDRGIGQILNAIHDTGGTDNTVVVFVSDNGGCAEFLMEDGEYDFVLPRTADDRPVRIGNAADIDPGGADTYMSYDLPWANASNTPFRLYKHWIHEGGIATPCVVRAPGCDAGSIVHLPRHFVDILPTFAEMAGAEFSGEGESMAANLRAPARQRPIFWEHEGNCGVRDGGWKLVSRFGQGWELYDMETDRTELNDLSDRYPDTVRDMAHAYHEWAARSGVVPWEEMAKRLPPAYSVWIEPPE